MLFSWRLVNATLWAYLLLPRAPTRSSRCSFFSQGFFCVSRFHLDQSKNNVWVRILSAIARRPVPVP